MSLLVRLSALAFIQVSRIFSQLTPAVAKDPSWKAEHGCAEQFEVLEAVVAANNHAEVKRVAHKLKGSCLAIGARNRGAICAEIEPNPVNVSELMTALVKEHERVLAALGTEVGYDFSLQKSI